MFQKLMIRLQSVSEITSEFRRWSGVRRSDGCTILGITPTFSFAVPWLRSERPLSFFRRISTIVDLI